MISVQGLTKKYGAKEAVSELNFEISRGEFVGFIGANGAGKSTTIKMLAGQLSPSAGTVIIDGFDVLKEPNQCRRNIGYVPEFPELYQYLTAREMLAFVISVRGQGDLDWGLEIAGLGADAERPIREYSQGMRRKTALACAMVAKPPVLILDEALNGLDPSSVKRFQDLFSQLKEEGTSIFLSTHVLDSLEKMASRIIYIKQGKLQADCPISALAQIRNDF